MRMIPTHHESLLLIIRLAIILLLYRIAECARKHCFNLEQELAYCTHKYKVQIPTNQLAGYSFGYGSLNDTEYMCRTKWHILVVRCMRRRSEESCRNSEEEKFRQLIWSISLETGKLERAAAYMCHEHNLRILREHQYQCLLRQEKASEQCTIHRNATIREVVVALQNQSSRFPSNSNEYYTLIKHTLSHYECKALRAKLECLYTVLHHACPPNAVRLIMNYFKETLPDACVFNYEARLLRYLEAQSNTLESLQRDNHHQRASTDWNRQNNRNVYVKDDAAKPVKQPQLTSTRGPRGGVDNSHNNWITSILSVCTISFIVWRNL